MRHFAPFLAALGCLMPLHASPQKPAAPAVAPSTKKADLVLLMKHLGIGSTNSEATHKQIQAARKDPKLANLPAGYWADLEKAANPQAFEQLLLPIFDKAYTHDEVRQLLRLMANPEFKLFMEKNPLQKLVREGYPAFSKYMDDQAKQLKEKYQAAPKAESKK